MEVQLLFHAWFAIPYRMCQYLRRLVLHYIIQTAVRNKEMASISFLLSAYMADRKGKDSTKPMMKHNGRSILHCAQPKTRGSERGSRSSDGRIGLMQVWLGRGRWSLPPLWFFEEDNSKYLFSRPTLCWVAVFTTSYLCD